MTAPSAADIARGLTKEFGPGCFSGIHAILFHDELPPHFSKADWDGWFISPSDAAFERAFDIGLIAPWKLSGKWSFTPLGLAVRAILKEQEA